MVVVVVMMMMMIVMALVVLMIPQICLPCCSGKKAGYQLLISFVRSCGVVE